MLFSPTTASVALGAALLSTLVLGKMLFFGKPKWDPRGKVRPVAPLTAPR